MKSGNFQYVRGMDALSGVLKALPEAMRNQILRDGVMGAVLPIQVAAKRFAKRSEDTGALRESITNKVVVYPQTGRAVGLVGPDRDYYWGRSKSRLGRLYKGARRPAKYAHLVEYGHLIAVGGSLKAQHHLELVGIGKFSKNGKELKRWKRGIIKTQAKGRAGGFVPAKPFIRPAVMTTMQKQSDAFFRAVERSYTRIVDREVRAGRHSRAA